MFMPMRSCWRRRAAAIGLAASTVFAARLAAQDTEPPPLLGRPIGTFAWTSLDDSTSIISPLSLRGSVVLIDLWGTWCGPCKREMPFLHDAYTRFHARGFEILSIAFDISPGKVTAFRRTQFPMPWQHVYATAAIEAEATRLFQLDGFPRAVLVDRDGVIVRVDAGLRGPALAATIDSVLNNRAGRSR
jgi:thiol-disulfide isomerase/thioredoxin